MQSPARSLQGLDALDLMTVDHPDAVELLGLQTTVLQKSVQTDGRLLHQAPQSID